MIDERYKPIKLAPWIYNRPNYYSRNHPNYHPDTNVYDDYWLEEEQRCIEGFWVLDQAGKTNQDKYIVRYCFY